MALDEARIWSCSGNGRVYYSSVSNPDWQCVSTNMTFIATGYCGVVCAIDEKDTLHVRSGVSDSNPLGQSWVSLLCECKHVCVGSTKLVRITSDCQMYTANLPNIIDKNIYLNWSVVNLQDNLSDSNLISVDIHDDLYIVDKSGDVYKYIDDHLTVEQSFWKLIVTAPKVPQGLMSRLRSFASLGLLSGENDGNINACGFYISEKYIWLTRRNSREIYQMEYDSSEEPVSSWSRFRLTYSWTVNCICGCQDSIMWAITSEGKLVTITCSGKKATVKECSTPSLSTEDHSTFHWANASIGFIRQFPLSRRSTVPSPVNASVFSPVNSMSRVPPSSLPLYPSLPVEEEERIELTSSGSLRQSRECCDDGSCGYCSGQDQHTANNILSPVLLTLQKRGYQISSLSGSTGSSGISLGVKRKHGFVHNGEAYITNERMILKAKRRKTRSKLPKQRILQGITFSLSQKRIKMDQRIMGYNPNLLQAVKIPTHVNEKLPSFELEEGYLSSNEETTVGVECAEDMEYSTPLLSHEIFQPPPLPNTSESLIEHSTENLSTPIQSCSHDDDSMESVTITGYSRSQEVSMPVPQLVVRPSQPESSTENLSTPVQSSSQDESMETFTFAGFPEHPVLLHRRPTINQQQPPPPAPPPPPIGTPLRLPLLKSKSSQVSYSNETTVQPVEESSTEQLSMVALPSHRHVMHQGTASSDDSTSE